MDIEIWIKKTKNARIDLRVTQKVTEMYCKNHYWECFMLSYRELSFSLSSKDFAQDAPLQNLDSDEAQIDRLIFLALIPGDVLSLLT